MARNVTSVDREKAKPRLRAAWAFSMLDHKQLAKDSGVHYDTVRALLAPSGGPRDVPLDVMHVIADACGVPRWFMEHGYAPPLEEVADDIRQRLAQQDDHLKRLDEELRRRAAEDDERLADLRRTVDVLLSQLERDPGQQFEQELQAAVQQAQKRLVDTAPTAVDQQQGGQAS